MSQVDAGILVDPEANRKPGIIEIIIILWLWVMMFTSYGPEWAHSDMLRFVPQLLLLLVAIPILARQHAENGMRMPREIGVYALWGVWCFLGLLVMVYPEVFWSCTGRHWKMAILFLLMAWACTSERRVRVLILGGLVGGTFLATILPAFGFGNLSVSEYSVVDVREQGALGSSNTLSYLSEISFLACMYAAVTARTLVTRLLWLLGMLYALYIAMKTGSRNAALGVLFAVVASYFLYFRARLRGWFRVVALVLVGSIFAGVLYALVVYSPFAWRFDTIAKLLQGDSTAFEESGRGMAYMGALRMTLDHPIVGVGLGHDYPFLVQYTGMGNMYIHSDLLGLGGIVGLPGLVLFYCIPILMLRRLNWIRKHPLLMPGELNSVLFFRVFLVCYLFRTIGSSVYENRIHWVLLGWILGYAYNKCIELRRREEYAPVLYESPIPDRAETTSISAPVLAPRQT